MRAETAAGCLALASLLSGCGTSHAETGQKSDGAAVRPSTVVIALDTSTSAKAIHEELYNRIVRQMEDMPPKSHLVVFRFDSSPAEIYDGPAINDGAEAGRRLKPELQWRSKTTGTNLAKLFDRIDKRLLAGSSDIEIHVYTDCGTEEMSEKDDGAVHKITDRWKADGDVHVAFHGVKTGHREALRDLVAFPVEID
ncbi:MAG: hypothetical protein JST30_14575 [Armatimonadetes bacterium]|nr:hypothetical protein [Armatimonadota bacterium]